MTSTAYQQTSYRDYTVVGTADELRNVVANHHTAGTLVALTAPAPNTPTDPRLRITLRLRTTAANPTTTARTRPTRPTRPRPARPDGQLERPARNPMPTWRRWLIAIAGLALAGAAAALVYLIWLVATFIADNALTILGGLTIAVITGAVLYGGSGRRHCPGC
jgi:hypothetical protein